MMNNMFNINQMGMNNMLNPMMGMNNQQNQMNGIFMNQMAQNTIQIYENKIRELEEIIKQKDFEINMLKQNLNTINNYFMNMNTTMMNMNMMPSNLMMGNMDNQNEDKKRKFYLTIISEKKREFINCFSDDKASILKEKFDLTGKFLSFNYKIIDYDLTIEENGINNGSFIYVVDVDNFQNIIFKNKQGIKNPISLNGDCPIQFALLYYYIMIGKIDFIMSNFCNEQADLNFSFNARKIKIGDKTPIKKFFSTYALPIVDVNE